MARDPRVLAEMVRDAAVDVCYHDRSCVDTLTDTPLCGRDCDVRAVRSLDLAPIIAAWEGQGGEPSEAHPEADVRAAEATLRRLRVGDTLVAGEFGALHVLLTSRAQPAPRTYTADEVRWMLEEAARQGAATHGVMGLQLHEQPFTIASRILSSPKAPSLPVVGEPVI